MGGFSVTAALLALLVSSSSYALSAGRPGVLENSTSAPINDNVHELQRRAPDPTSFAWVHRLAAIGDSFTAGIGSGNQLGGVFHNNNDWLCSRYDLSYPVLVNNLLGPSVKNFQFPACSGDRSTGIYEQVQKMQGDLNMVIMTAGGNDLCLVWLTQCRINWKRC